MATYGMYFTLASVMMAMPGRAGADSGSILCAFVDEAWFAQRDAAMAATWPPGIGMFAEDNLANKIKSRDNSYIDPGSNGEVQRDNRTIRCPNSRAFCYTLWEGDGSSGGKVNIIKQGCWEQPETCSQSSCVARSPTTRSHNNTHFCCCTGDLCNVNVTSEYGPEVGEPPDQASTPRYRILPDSSYRDRTIIISLVSVFVVALVIALAYLACRLVLTPRNGRPYKPGQLIESPPTPMFDLDQLKVWDLISQGRYGDVYRGSLYEHPVAIKMFGPLQKQYFINERDLFTLPHMEHSGLLRFYGSEEHFSMDGGRSTVSVIVTGYVPSGTLTQYLKEHTVDWAQLCRFALSAASALAHLHTDIVVGDKEKPAVAHRDFNSRNILIKDDLTCCICDFGFAMKILGSKFIRNGLEEIAEQSPISDVGTLRYMAPEVLDGAVNLRDCEASLKQIDVYAMGLVIWEIASRCSDLYQGMPVPDYKLPFEAELGPHPSFEDMQRHVSWKRGRPVFPDVWKDTNQAIRALKETIEDSWDQDAEARLTSLCVEERILEMGALWETRNKVGVTPTNPVTLLGNMPDQILRNQTSDATTAAGHHLTDEPDHHLTPACVQAGGGGGGGGGPALSGLDLPPGVRLQSNRLENSASGSTVETTLTTSPSDPLPPSSLDALPPSSGAAPPVLPVGKASNLYARPHQPLQPHQGQNPTVERNTHKRSDDKLVVLGNTLVDQSVAEEVQAQQGERAAGGGGGGAGGGGGGATGGNHFTEEFFEAIADNLESSLVQNDLLGQQQYPSSAAGGATAASAGPAAAAAGTATAAPSTAQPQQPQPPPVMMVEPYVTRPKQPNVPGNGSAYPQHHRVFPPPQPPTHTTYSHKPKNRFRFKKPRTDKLSGKMSGLYMLGKNLLRGAAGGGGGGGHESSSDDGSNYYPTENLRNPAQMAASGAKPPSSMQAAGGGAGTLYQEMVETNPGKSNLGPRGHVLTEVRLMNGAPVVRPMSLPLSAGRKDARGGGPLPAPPRRHSTDLSMESSGSGEETLLKYREDSEANMLHSPAARRQGEQAAAAAEQEEEALQLAEVGVAKLQPPSRLPAAGGRQPQTVRLRAQSSIDLSPTGGAAREAWEEEARVRRPCSLSVNGHNYKKAPQSVPCLRNAVGGGDQDEPDETLPLTGSTAGRETDCSGRARHASGPEERLLSRDVGEVAPPRGGARQAAPISLAQFGGGGRRDTGGRAAPPADYPC